MIVATGNVISLEQLGIAFLEFAQQSSDTIDACILKSNTLSTFWGATLQVNMNKCIINDVKPCYYITLQHSNITDDSYKEFLNTEHSYMSETFTGFRNDQYAFGRYGGLNPFSDDGEFLAIGLHTKFDPILWMCEQSHITCDAEMRVQDATKYSNLMEASYFYKNSFLYHDLVYYPGTGCPWFTLSKQDRVEFLVDTYGIDYWFTRNEYDFTITIRVVGDGTLTPHWQSVSFGLLQAVSDDSYMFPLYVAGGSQGIDFGSYAYSVYSIPTCKAFNFYSLSIKNNSLANSYLLLPTKFNGNSFSNFKVLAPDGVWKNVFSASQEGIIEPITPCVGPVTSWYTYVKDPVSFTGGHLIFPQLSREFSYTVDTYDVKARWDEFHSSSPIMDVYVIFNKDIDYGVSGVQGKLSQNYWSWSKSLRSGEVIVAGRKWLAVPNGWERRRFAYSKVNTMTGQQIVSYDEDIINPLHNLYMCVKMLIPLEDLE